MFDFNEGAVIPLYKPYGITSFAAVKKVRWLTRASKVGHAGTLDPLAEGLLIICTGKFTKQAETFQAMPKEYTGIIELGASRPSYDMETEINEVFATEHITESMIQEAARSFEGIIDQIPPAYSAIKVDGKRAYDNARSGIKQELKSRPVEIYSFEILSVEMPEIHFRVHCSKGTYIRSLAHDIGIKLQSGAYLKKLIRTRIGDFTSESSYTLDQFESMLKEFKSTIERK